MICYIKWRKLQEFTWRLHPDAANVFDISAFRHHLSVSIPSAMIIWSEWWAFEVLAIFVGWTPNSVINLAAHGTMFNIIVVCYMSWTSIGGAVCTLVGNLLGSGRNHSIPPLLRAAFFLSFTTSMLVVLVYELFKGCLAAAFTRDAAVRNVMVNSSLGLALSVPLYAQLMTFYGALRGANR